MLAPQSWLPKAEAVRFGQSVRVDHDCGGGRTLKISRDERGLRAFCFRCNDTAWAPPPAESLADKLARLGRAAKADALCQELRRRPEPAVYDVDDWPIAARLWFFKAGLSRADIGNLNAYWHVPSERVVLQYQDFWIARALDKQRQPKYLSGDRRPELIVRWGSAPVPTLCEDILSAYKVGLVAEGWAVLGTKIPDAVVAALLQRRSANVWLDPDPAGQRAAARITRQLKAYGVTVRNITSARDPKLHTLEDIFHATR